MRHQKSAPLQRGLPIDERHESSGQCRLPEIGLRDANPGQADAAVYRSARPCVVDEVRKADPGLLGQERGAWGPDGPVQGVGFLVSMALVGGTVAVIVPIAIGYAARHGEGEYAGHVRNGHAR